MLYISEEELQSNCHEAAHPGNGDKRRELRRTRRGCGTSLKNSAI
jgi:hypothetical protein